jgi:antitoxin ParD1/3/4
LQFLPIFGNVAAEVGIMSKNTSFALGDHFASFVEAKVAEGRYASASDVVRAGLRLLEEHEAKLAALRTALIEGETSGVATSFDFDAFLARKRDADATEP